MARHGLLAVTLVVMLAGCTTPPATQDVAAGFPQSALLQPADLDGGFVLAPTPTQHADDLGFSLATNPGKMTPAPAAEMVPLESWAVVYEKAGHGSLIVVGYAYLFSSAADASAYAAHMDCTLATFYQSGAILAGAGARETDLGEILQALPSGAPPFLAVQDSLDGVLSQRIGGDAVCRDRHGVALQQTLHVGDNGPFRIFTGDHGRKSFAVPVTGGGPVRVTAILESPGRFSMVLSGAGSAPSLFSHAVLGNETVLGLVGAGEHKLDLIPGPPATNITFNLLYETLPAPAVTTGDNGPFHAAKAEPQWFALDLPGPASVTVTLHADASLPHLIVRSANGTQLALGTYNAQHHREATAALPQGRSFIEVESPFGPMDYTLVVKMG